LRLKGYPGRTRALPAEPSFEGRFAFERLPGSHTGVARAATYPCIDKAGEAHWYCTDGYNVAVHPKHIETFTRGRYFGHNTNEHCAVGSEADSAKTTSPELQGRRLRA
jgi:hypothetical protein